VSPDVPVIRKLPNVGTDTVHKKWEDLNGHVNIVYYMSLYNDSSWPLLGLIGADEAYFLERKMGIVDLNNNLHYMRELHVGDKISTYVRFLDRKPKLLHGMLFIVNDASDALACTVEFTSISFDLDKRKSTPFPDDIASKLETITTAHKALDWSVPASLSLLRPK